MTYSICLISFLIGTLTLPDASKMLLIQIAGCSSTELIWKHVFTLKCMHVVFNPVFCLLDVYTTLSKRVWKAYINKQTKGRIPPKTLNSETSTPLSPNHYLPPTPWFSPPHLTTREDFPYPPLNMPPKPTPISYRWVAAGTPLLNKHNTKIKET